MAKWIETMSDDSSEEEEEEEALSLCDLPIKLTKKTTTGDNLDEEEALLVGDDKEDSSEFDFGWWGNNCSSNNMNGSSRVSSDSQMCAADELFFNGQILPLRHSVSSDTPLLRFMSRSDSLDHSSVTRFISCRSSSIGSYNSSASSSNSSSINSNYNHIPRTSPKKTSGQKPQFPIHASPKPQTINIANNRQRNPRISQQPPYGNKSTVWDFFRTGLVRGPEIELRDLNKLRSFRKPSVISRNNSMNSDVTTSKIKSSRHGFLSRGSCKCSVDSVLPTKEILVPGKNSGASHSRDQEGTLLLQYSKPVMMTRENAKKEKVKEKKESMSRRRASEWLKELSLSHESSCRGNETGKRMISGVP